MYSMLIIRKYFAIAIILLSIFVFQRKVVYCYNCPLYGFLDTETWEYNGYFVKENISFNPFPKIQFQNNNALYPYGGNFVFQSWSFERDFIFAAFNHFFGVGPWLQIYYILSIFISFAASYFLLKKDFGLGKSLFTAFIIVFFNFYAMFKYPFHLSYATFHWMQIGMILDFLIFRKYLLENKIELNYLFLRIGSIFLSLGLDLGAVSGFSIFSFVLNFSLAFLIFVARTFQNKKFDPNIILIPANKKIVFVSIILAIVSIYLYIPILIDIYKMTNEIILKSEPITTYWIWWASPFRIFIPFLSYFKDDKIYEGFFGDHPEGLSSGGCGLFMLVIAIIGFIQSKNKKIFIPLLFLFFIYLINHPENFPILNTMPWFKHLRVANRATLTYPIIFGLLSLEINYDSFNTKVKKIFLISLFILGILELRTAYSSRPKLEARLDKNVFEYMTTIKESKGVAILDWPFCISGGNFDSHYCPFPLATSYSYALRRFHQKKVVGQFLGRLYSVNTDPFEKNKWKDLRVFNYDIHNAMLQTSQNYECFSEKEWQFFDRFYIENDFAGIQLHESVIPKKCLNEFYFRYGEPIRSADLPFTGKISFIPRK